MLLSSTHVYGESEKQTELYTNGLKQVKYYMVNGEILKAQMALDHLGLYQSQLSPIHIRYEAINQFILGDYYKSTQSLEKLFKISKNNRLKWIPKTCELYLLNLFITDTSPRDIQMQWDKCLIDSNATGKVPSQWIQAMVDLRMMGQVGAINRSVMSMTNTELMSALKLSMYLNQSQDFLDGLASLNANDLSDPLLRELVGEVFYRNHRLVDAMESLRGLETPNAMVIKADIMIMQNKYELAYAMLKKAYEQKNYSEAVLKRLIPLAIMLDQMKDLENFLDNYSRINSITTQIESLAAYSYYNQNQGKKAVKLLRSIDRKINLTVEEISLMTISSYQFKDDRDYENGYNLCALRAEYCWLPIIDAYDLKRSKSRQVESVAPFDQYLNLIDEGSLADEENLTIDVEDQQERQQFYEYLRLRK